MKKYEFTGETTNSIDGVELKRIRAVKDIGMVKAGELGGWIEKEENLSQEGLAWVSGNAQVSGNAEIFGNALVFGDAEIFGNARIWRNAQVYDNALVFSNAQVYGNSLVCGNARVHGNSLVCGDSLVCGNAHVYGNSLVCGNALVRGNAEIRNYEDILVIDPIGSRHDATTFFRAKDKQIVVRCGCFYGTIEEFAERVKETHGNNKHARAYNAAIELAKIQIDLDD